MADLAPMDQDEDMADGPPDDGVDILEEAAPDESIADFVGQGARARD